MAYLQVGIFFFFHFSFLYQLIKKLFEIPKWNQDCPTAGTIFYYALCACEFPRNVPGCEDYTGGAVSGHFND